MEVIHISIYAITIAFCLAFVIVSQALFKQLSLKYFRIYLCLVACHFAFEWLLTHPGSPYKSLWLGFIMISSLLMAPCVWLFTLETHSNKVPSLHEIRLPQIALIVSAALFIVPLLLTSHSGHLFTDPDKQQRFWLESWVHEGMLIAIFLYLLQVPWYLARCRRILQSRGRLNQFLFSNVQEPTLHALRCLLWLMAANWCFSLGFTARVFFFGSSLTWHLIFNLFEVATLLWALYAVLVRCWHFNLDQHNLLNSLSDDVSEKPKYSKSALDNNTRKRILSKLDALFENEKIYRNSQLKLQDLNQKTGENLHYLSQVINEDKGCTFYELVRNYRIEEAKQLLLNHPEKSILEIALEVGFNAKSTFNSAFKLLEGTTPSGYRKT